MAQRNLALVNSAQVYAHRPLLSDPLLGEEERRRQVKDTIKTFKRSYQIVRDAVGLVIDKSMKTSCHEDQERGWHLFCSYTIS